MARPQLEQAYNPPGWQRTDTPSAPPNFPSVWDSSGRQAESEPGQHGVVKPSPLGVFGGQIWPLSFLGRLWAAPEAGGQIRGRGPAGPILGHLPHLTSSPRLTARSNPPLNSTDHGVPWVVTIVGRIWGRG